MSHKDGPASPLDRSQAEWLLKFLQKDANKLACLLDLYIGVHRTFWDEFLSLFAEDFAEKAAGDPIWAELQDIRRRHQEEMISVSDSLLRLDRNNVRAVAVCQLLAELSKE